MSGTAHAPSIAAHRLLGDGSSTALLRPDGEIDWWCAPELDDPPVLWSLLDADGAAARWRDVRLASASGRAAGPGLRTVLQTASGRVETFDGLLFEQDRGSTLIRLARGLDADLDLTHELSLGGFDQPWGIWNGAATELQGRTVRVLGGTSHVEGSHLVTQLQAARQQWIGCAITFDPHRSGDPAALLADLEQAVREDDELTAAARLPRHGPERVRDALRVLRMCTYAATGAVIAAPTTSLPEAPGFGRQWDYRFSWLRDASLAVSVAALLGRPDIGESYLSFVLKQAPDGELLDGPMTTVRGDEVPDEREVEGVAGWAGSLPVRVGNGARSQIQYDALGLFVEAVSVHVQCGGDLADPVWALVRRIADELSRKDLERQTSGIWELREPRELLSADIGIWIALDRAVWIARGWHPFTRRAVWVKARHAARERVIGALQEDGGLPQAYGDDARSADARALMAVIFRLFDRRDPRAGRLVDATLVQLDAAPFLYRYEPGDGDGLAGVEGAVLPASWWVVSALAACGRRAEAEARAEALDRALPALLPEEIDPESRQGLGNVPLVWSHMEAARAMYLLDSARLQDRYGVVGLSVWRIVRWARAKRRN